MFELHIRKTVHNLMLVSLSLRKNCREKRAFLTATLISPGWNPSEIKWCTQMEMTLEGHATSLDFAAYTTRLSIGLNIVYFQRKWIRQGQDATYALSKPYPG